MQADLDPPCRLVREIGPRSDEVGRDDERNDDPGIDAPRSSCPPRLRRFLLRWVAPRSLTNSTSGAGEDIPRSRRRLVMRGSDRTWEEPMHEVSHRRTVQPSSPAVTAFDAGHRLSSLRPVLSRPCSSRAPTTSASPPSSAGEAGCAPPTSSSTEALAQRSHDHFDQRAAPSRPPPEPSFHYLALLRLMDWAATRRVRHRPSGPSPPTARHSHWRPAPRGMQPMTRPCSSESGPGHARDLDPDERVAVRVVTGGGESASLYLDGDRNVLMVNASRSVAQRIEPLLRKHFPESSPHRPHHGEPDGEPMYDSASPSRSPCTTWRG